MFTSFTDEKTTWLKVTVNIACFLDADLCISSYRDHSSSTSTKCSKKTNISYSLIRTCECQRAGNVGFSENFAYVLNEKIRNLTYHLTTSNFEDCMTAHLIKVRDHPFSTYKTFSKKLLFLTPDKHTYVWASGGNKC